jgi:WD repeat-containing protein 35
MFVYLSKKVALPSETHILRALSWNQEEGWIACGGKNGLLKVIKLEPPVAPAPGQAPQSNLSMNQTLEGHHGDVTVVTWNESFQKLTTSDEEGLIIVWMLHRNMWLEEMINNRNKSIVKDMQWSSDGTKICIVYEDGAVIVGSVEGSRLWGKELTHQLSQLQWSPDSRMLLFGTPEGEVHRYDTTGKQLDPIKIKCLRLPSVLARITWFDGGGYKALAQGENPNPTLCISYECGKVQLMKNENDEDPIILDTEMIITCAAWNNTGSMLAVSGSYKSTAVVQFYTAMGIHMRTLTVPGSEKVGAVSWEGNGLRVAMTVDSVIYFANIKPDYKWCYFNGTAVYAYMKQDRPDFCVVFWDTKSDERYLKYVKKLLTVSGSGDYCVLATKAEENSTQFVLILCNAIGSPVDSKNINIEPHYMGMTKTHCIVCSEDYVYIWQYRSQVSRLLSLDATKRKIGREIAFHIDETPDLNSLYDPNKFRATGRTNSDPISCVAAGEGFFIVGRVSGVLQRYTIPHVTQEARYVLNCRPQLISVNCNASMISVIDINGILTFFDTKEKGGKHLETERKDVWDMKWSTDNPDMIVIMEKARMHVLTNLESEDPVISSGYLCDFKDLEIKAVLLDDIMKSPDVPGKAEELVLNFESKALRDTKSMVQTMDLRDAYDHVDRNPHPRLWKILAEAAIEKLDFDIAHKAFVKCDDYQGIKFVNKVKKLDDVNKQKAEVAIYFKNFDEAENIYKSIDRRDLALEMRSRIGDWFKVVQLLQQGVGSDEMFTVAYNQMGEYYSDRFRWNKAAAHFASAQNNERLIESYYHLEDFEGLSKMIEVLPDESPLLQQLGDMFQGVGLCEEAVQAYLKAGNVRQAIDCCVLLNQWNQAVELAEKFNFVQIEGLLSRYANHLIEENKKVEAIQLYRKANRNTEAAKILNKIAKDMSKEQTSPTLLKKIYVMAALEVDSYKKRMFEAQLTGQTTTAQTLESLITSDINTMTDKTLDNPWRGAEAYHFYLMAQRQLYNGDYESALKTSIRLGEYENVLDTRDIYSLIALSAFYSGFYKECSRALVKLENLSNQREEEREAYEALSVAIFSKYTPKNPNERMVPCPGKGCTSTVSSM